MQSHTIFFLGELNNFAIAFIVFRTNLELISLDNWGGYDRPTYPGISRNIGRIRASIVY